MNTESIRRAAEVIHAAEKRSTVPVTLAIALDAAGWLNTPETAAELSRLRARVAELERPEVEAKRAEIRNSYAELITQARQDRDYEGAFDVECKLRKREAQWLREDAYVSPLHQNHKISHDLPEVPRG